MLELSPEDRQKLFYDNARRILGLKGARTPALSGRVA
jgi:predicted TIM-barrel fold metal-dependent hydrolase